ncbi:hypothetical protein PGIGA_G00041790, partial [Pangasianodon gigas]|nr:hypothetical protein [Pangasianodon gigas]
LTVHPHTRSGAIQDHQQTKTLVQREHRIRNKEKVWRNGKPHIIKLLLHTQSSITKNTFVHKYNIQNPISNLH